MKWIINGFKHKFDYDGRTSRKAFWMFWLWMMVVLLPLMILDYYTDSEVLHGIIWIVSLLFSIQWCVLGVRRLHDIGESGKMFILIFILPFLSLYYFSKPGEPYENEWGPTVADNV